MIDFQIYLNLNKIKYYVSFYPRPLREEHGSSDGLFLLFLLFFFFLLFHTSRALFLLGTERFC